MYGMFPGNAVVVNFLMRFPALIPVAAISGGLAVATPIQKEQPIIPVVIEDVKPEPVQCVVYFDTDKYSITTSQLSNLDTCVSKAVYKVKKIVIDGHTDIRNGIEYNIELSKNRANTVASHMNSLGYSMGSMEINYHGLSIPAASNYSQKGMALNRRVTVKLVP